MGRVLTSLDADLAEFVEAQPLFFVATAPAGSEGHVNVSPKGLDTFRVVDARTVAYLDLTGSGVETIAHLGENGRITLLFCGFAGEPRIVRLYGRGVVRLSDDPRFALLAPLFPAFPGTRALIEVALERVQTSCGFGVPRLELRGERDELVAWAERKGPAALATYRRERNATSVDGLPTPFGRTS